MTRSIGLFIIWAGIPLAGICSLQAAQVTQTSPAAVQYRAVLTRYCVTCHNEKLKTAGLVLDQMDLTNVPAKAEVWEKVIRKLRGGAMPPPRLPRPDQATYDSFATFLETSIDRAATSNPGRPALRRLNRAEYGNAIRDLLAVEIDAASLLPTDDSGYGFDNIGDVLSVSPTLLERYVSAAWKISGLAIGNRANLRPGSETYEVPVELKQADRMSEELPLGSRGGLVARHNFPADGEYVIAVRLLRDGDRANGNGNLITGIALKRLLDVRLDDKRLTQFTFGGKRPGESKQQTAEYEIQGDATLTVRFPAKAGPHSIGVAFRSEDNSKREDMEHGAGGHYPRGGRTDEPGIESITITGPYDAKGVEDTPSRRRIFSCYPSSGTEVGNINRLSSAKRGEDEETCARKILTTLAHRAYRRPITPGDLQALFEMYVSGRGRGGFDEGIRLAVERILAGPEFLFRVERDPANVTPGTAYRLSDLELASRLSFFLWSSLPDDQLLDAAERGRLKDPVVLEQQVRRMLRDSRSKALVSNFFGQWLQLRSVGELSPDPGEFPGWDENLRNAFQEETKLFLESMIEEDRPLMDLLGANYTFLNERLARHYGVPNVYGSSFRRVTLADEDRRGLLGQGSVLTLTSYPTRTSVVLRGVWLLTNILATPPPPPPPDVPPLKDRSEDGALKSVRQAMEEHRANPVCASCHLRMDPLGFAMENFDGIGRWRTTEGDGRISIDNAGELPDGTRLRGPRELRSLLMKRPTQFATAATEKLLTYGIGRGTEYFDEPVVRKIVREAGPDYRWSSLILGVVKSAPFQMRRKPKQ